MTIFLVALCVVLSLFILKGVLEARRNRYRTFGDSE